MLYVAITVQVLCLALVVGATRYIKANWFESALIIVGYEIINVSAYVGLVNQ